MQSLDFQLNRVANAAQFIMLYMSFDFGTALIDVSLNLQHINGFVLAADSALMPIPSHQKAHFF